MVSEQQVDEHLDYSKRLRAADYFVADALLGPVQEMVRQYHYSRGGSNTAVYTHGLYRKVDGVLVGAAWWLPPTRVACESVNRAEWQKVLSLTRLVVLPNVPRNACSFLIARSVRTIWKEDRFWSLVTYADESEGHEGRVYRACNFHYIGKTGPYTKFVDANGRQVAAKATKNRRKAEMEALGYRKAGSFYKHKYVLHSPKHEWPEEFKEWLEKQKAERLLEEILS
jgi:hypothetical protein